MEELTRIRKEREWSQQQLANESGVNKATINQIERGRRSPNVETLEKLARAMGVEVVDFFPKAEPRLPLGPAAGGNNQHPDLRMLATFMADMTGDIEEWFASETRDVGGDAGELNEQDFLLFAGTASGFAQVHSRMDETLEEILPVARASAPATEVQRVERAFARLTTTFADMITPKLKERLDAIVNQEEGAGQSRTNLFALEGMKVTA